MNRRKLRQAIRKAISACKCTDEQKSAMRWRLLDCNSEDTLDVVEDELTQCMGVAAQAQSESMDWGKIVDILIKIIEEFLASK